MTSSTGGNTGAQKRKRAEALLLAHEGYTDEMIAERVGMHCRAIEDFRQRFVEDGFETTLEGKARGHRPRSLQGADEARLIALVCGLVPEGCARWTLRLLADSRVTLENTDTKAVSRETIRQTLKKTKLSPGKAGNGVYPRRQTRSLSPVWRMYSMSILGNRNPIARWYAWMSVRNR
jgi:transposase